MDLHYVQLEVLRALLFNPETNFSELNTKGISSDLLAYHLKKLIQLKLVAKTNKKYALTAQGKEFANRIDTENSYATIEHQAKLGVIVWAFEGKAGKSKMVVQTRLKEPFFGFKGGITGKMKYGETIFDTASRELLEEAGLRGEMKYHGFAHIINVQQGNVVEDKFQYVLTATNCSGNLLEADEGLKNEWMTIEEYKQQENVYDGIAEIIDMCFDDTVHFIERIFFPEKF